jgi:pyruvate kinase
MSILRDVQAVKFTHISQTPAGSARDAVRQLFAEGKLSEGDRVVLTHGDHIGQGGGTNTLKLLSVGAEGVVECLRDL